MDHLKEYIRGAIEFQKENFDVKDMDEEEIFECVMENVVSMVGDYNFTDYSKEN